MDALERLIDDTQEAPPFKEGLPGEFNRPAKKKAVEKAKRKAAAGD